MFKIYIYIQGNKLYIQFNNLKLLSMRYRLCRMHLLTHFFIYMANGNRQVSMSLVPLPTKYI